MWAFRYALGRRTGAVDDVVRHIKMYWDQLEPFTQNQIREEINTAIGTERAGDQCDIDSWKEIFSLPVNCACMINGKKDPVFKYHSVFNCSNEEYGVSKA